MDRNDHKDNHDNIDANSDIPANDLLNDPNLTAYALGELDDTDAEIIATIEAQLETNTEARAFVAEVQATAQTLTDELHSETGPTLSDDAAQSLVTQAVAQSALSDEGNGPIPFAQPTPPSSTGVFQSRWFRVSASLAGMAAVVTIGIGLPLLHEPAQEGGAGDARYAMEVPSQTPGRTDSLYSASRKGNRDNSGKIGELGSKDDMRGFVADPNEGDELADWDGDDGFGFGEGARHAVADPPADAAPTVNLTAAVPFDSPQNEIARMAAPTRENTEQTAEKDANLVDGLASTATGADTEMLGLADETKAKTAPTDAPPSVLLDLMGGLKEAEESVDADDVNYWIQPGLPDSTENAELQALTITSESHQRQAPPASKGRATKEEDARDVRTRRRSEAGVPSGEAGPPALDAHSDEEVPELSQIPMEDSFFSNTLETDDDELVLGDIPLLLRLDLPGKPEDELREIARKNDLTDEELAVVVERYKQQLHEREDARRQANEEYARITDNAFKAVDEEPLSTFSVDVDTASYANVRRFINGMSTLPPADAVRIEELINNFDHDYEPPSKDAEHPFAVHTEVNACPWNPRHRLAKIGLKGYEVSNDDRPATNLVFLIDTSGSMSDANKLPLVQRSLVEMVEHLTVDDRIAIVSYAGSSQIVLPSTAVHERQKIITAIESLGANGSTNGESGINMSYEIATENFIKEGTNRVILCTDGDFNVGISNESGLLKLIEDQRQTGVFLSVLGFGMGNYKDNKLELLANSGNGNYAYIDDYDEAQKVLVDRMAGTLMTIAKDVKFQVEFNPAVVSSYRLIGYENRILAAQDFNDDTKDAGEIGAGHTVTALYEIVPVSSGVIPQDDVDPLVYQKTEDTERANESGELFNLKLRYKQPNADESVMFTLPISDAGEQLADASEDFQFTAAVASFGMLLRQSPHRGRMTYAYLMDLAVGGRGDIEKDNRGDRSEFISLIRRTHEIAPSVFNRSMVIRCGMDADRE